MLSLPAAAPSADVMLNNGVSMPRLAFGANVWDGPTCANATAEALAAGFRFIWSSQLVGSDCQRAQGRVINASPLKGLFVAGTADTATCTSEADCYTATKAAAEQQFELLGRDQLDMLMLDYPPSTAGCSPILGQWRAFEEIYRAHRVRTIAVSNYDADQMRCITAQKNLSVPSVNQLSLSVGTDPTVVASMAALGGIAVQAYSPLGHGGLISAPLLQTIGKAHSKTSAQVALRWIVQHNASITTQSRSASHLRDDTKIFDWALSDDEMAQLDRFHP